MWLTINIVIFLLCMCGVLYAKSIDNTENYNALFIGAVSVAIFAVDLISFIAWFFLGRG
jgi:hypothetical protein